MAGTPLDVVGIGNAIVDVIAHSKDAFLADEGLVKGTMTLIDEARGEAIYSRMGPGTESSGGSAANTIAGFASFGGKAGFIGKVRADQLGRVFRHDIESLGVVYRTPAATEGPSTARCLVMVSPDAQRTMATFLGISTQLGPEDLDRDLIASAKTVYLEGYLWDPPQAKQAFLEAAKIAHQAGGQVALSLSDAFCVERHRDDFRTLIEGHVDVLFANEVEILSLTQAKTFDEAAAQIRGKCKIAALTRSEKGSVVLAGDQTVSVPAEPVDRLVDTTGAGDLYAAGFLYGLSRGRDIRGCATLGGLAAAEVISHVGARPQVSLAELAAKRHPTLMKG
ncbi:MAG: adenosine kinase [Alphaproteobacteria bacterium]|nr:adenosine kinase [Alphaproteobacteria bacterium]